MGLGKRLGGGAGRLAVGSSRRRLRPVSPIVDIARLHRVREDGDLRQAGRNAMRRLEDRTFLLLIVVISLAFAWVTLPFYGAILWGVVAAIMLAPVNRRLLAMAPGRANLAASGTLLILVAMVIVPALLLGMALLQEVSSLYAKAQSGGLDLDHAFGRLQGALPAWMTTMLDQLGLTDIDSVRTKIAASIGSALRLFAAQALNLGQSAFAFLVGLSVMLYLTFFLLRDGSALARRIEDTVPLHAAQQEALVAKFTTVIRATIKGSLVVAILQGAIGGTVFWALGIEAALLWGVLMAFMSLLPAIGTGIVWVPVAIYLLATGAIWQGLVLVFCGLFVIGMVDNLLRPILVGKDAKMPDYVVLISTLGGIELLGFNGVVIGPVVAALFIAVWDIASDARRRTTPAVGAA